MRNNNVNTKGKSKVLIIEDDPGQQKLIQMIFKYSPKGNSIVTECSYDLKQALLNLEEKDYDVIVCDLRLPYSDSVEYTIELVEKYKKEAKVIYCTVEDITAELQQKINKTNSTFISKNVNFLNYIQREFEAHL